MKMKKLLAGLVSAFMVFSFASVSFASDSVQSQLSPDELENITRFANDLGLSNEVRDSLIQKIESGGLPDSDNPAKKDSGIEEEITSGNQKIKRIVFPDGSVIQSTVIMPTEPKPLITPRIVDNTTGWVESGSGYKKFFNATVREDTVLVKAKFYADYVVVNGGYDYISNVFDGYTEIAAGYANNVVAPTIVNAYESSSAPARAVFSFTYVKINGTSSSDYKLSLYVRGDSPSSQLDHF